VTAARDLPRALVDTIAQETDGNPFFAREIIVHLAEEGKLEPAEGGSSADLTIDDLGIPEGVRQVVGQRLSRLSDEANRLLGVACAFSGAFCFEVARRVAELDEHCALDGVDEALEAQILGPTGDPETYEFSHALIGHTMYTEMNPSRQVRVHRHIAEQMEEVWRGCASEHAAQIAEHYHLSAALPGAERGVAHCLAAADSAERAAAHEQVAAFLRMALELMTESDTHRPRVMAHLGLALARSVSLQEATNIAGEAAALIAADEGPGAAADYLAEAADAVWGTAFDSLAWRLAQQGLDYVGERRDITWFALCGYDLARREAEDPDSPGIHLDSPERRELGEWSARYPVEFGQYVNKTWSLASVAVSSREEIQARFNGNSAQRSFVAGEYRLFVSHFRQRANAELEAGQLAAAALAYTVLARIECAVGELDASARSYAQALELSERLPRFPFLALQMGAATMERNTMVGGGSGTGNTEVIFVEALLTEEAIENRWVMGVWRWLGSNSHCRRSSAVRVGRSTMSRWCALPPTRSGSLSDATI